MAGGAVEPLEGAFDFDVVAFADETAADLVGGVSGQLVNEGGEFAGEDTLAVFERVGRYVVDDLLPVLSGLLEEGGVNVEVWVWDAEEERFDVVGVDGDEAGSFEAHGIGSGFAEGIARCFDSLALASSWWAGHDHGAAVTSGD